MHFEFLIIPRRSDFELLKAIVTSDLKLKFKIKNLQCYIRKRWGVYYMPVQQLPILPLTPSNAISESEIIK